MADVENALGKTKQERKMMQMKEENRCRRAFYLRESSTIPKVSRTATKIKRKSKNGIIVDVLEKVVNLYNYR